MAHKVLVHLTREINRVISPRLDARRFFLPNHSAAMVTAVLFLQVMKNLRGGYVKSPDMAKKVAIIMSD